LEIGAQLSNITSQQKICLSSDEFYF